MQFELLGPLRVRANNIEVDTGGGKQRKVLATLLVARGAVVSTDRLVDVVWGEDIPTKPNLTLRSYVSHLRRILEPEREAGNRARTLVTRAPGYALEIESASFDAALFETGVEGARELIAEGSLPNALAELTKALGLWRSDQLGDGVLDPLDPEVVRFFALRRSALELRIDLLVELGRHAEALPELESLVTANPLQEGLRRLHMTALYRAGRKGDALASFQTGRDASIEQLGLDPGIELQDLEHRVLRDDPTLLLRTTSNLVTPSVPNDTLPDLPPPPIGRLDVVHSLTTQLRAAAEGHASFTALTGEPGIGKTTLLRHLVLLAQSHRFQVVIGRCHDGGASSPLSPWRAVLSTLTASLDRDELAAVLGDRAAIVNRLLAVETPAQGPSIEGAPPGPDQHALFHATVHLVRQLAERKPLLLAFEDLHWADAVTLKLLVFAIPELTAARVFIATTWRDTESLDPPILSGLADLGRLAGSERHAISGLTTADATAIYNQQFGQRLEGHLAEAVITQSAGNPLFLTELLRSLALTGEIRTTDTIRDVLQRRIDNLRVGSEAALVIGALCPDGFTEQLVADLTDATLDESLELLEEALAARLIEEDPDAPQKFRFTHAVIAETLVARISSRRQARLHAAIGSALVARGESNEILAHHFLHGASAGSHRDGAEYAHRAAVQSIRLWDYNRASDLLEGGLAALELGADDEVLRADLLIDLMQVRKHQDRAMDAHVLGSQAFDAALSVGDVERMAVASLVYCGWPRPTEGRQTDQWLGYWSPPGPSIAMLASCVEKIPADHWLRIAVLTALAAQHFGEYEDLEYCKLLFDEAIALAEKHDEPEILVAVLLNKYHKFQRTMSIAEREGLANSTLAITQRAGMANRGVAARRARMVLALDRKDPAAADEEVRAMQAVARSSEDPLASMNTEVGRVSLEVMRGNLAQAEADIHLAFAEYAELGPATLDQFGLQYSVVAREFGRLDEVEAMLRWKLAGYPGPAFAGPLAAILVSLDRQAEAEEIIRGFSRQELTSGGEGVLQFITPAFFAEAIVDLGDKERAEWLYDALLPARSRVVAMFDGIASYGCGSYYLGRLATVLDRHLDAVALLDEAEDFLGRIGARPYELRTLLAQTELAGAMNDGTRRGERLAKATDLAAELGMSWLVDRANR